MKKIILFAIITLTQIYGYSQNYKFDKLFNYNISLQNIDRSVYCNSIDKNIFLEIRSDYYGLYASLNDLNNNEYHRFKIDTVRIEKDLHLDFTYEYTSEIKIYNLKNQYFEYETISEDSIYLEGIMKIYKNKNKKKLVNMYNVRVLKGDINYFNVYRFIFIHPYENNKNLNIEIGGTIKSTDFFNGETNVSIKLISVEETNINIIVPDKKNIKTFSN